MQELLITKKAAEAQNASDRSKPSKNHSRFVVANESRGSPAYESATNTATNCSTKNTKSF